MANRLDKISNITGLHKRRGGMEIPTPNLFRIREGSRCQGCALWLGWLMAFTIGCAAAAETVPPASGVEVEKTAGKHDLKAREQAAELYNAIVDNDIEKIKAALQKGLSPEERYLRNMSAMELAANTGRPEAMDLLIRSGGDPNHKNKKNIPLLALALDNHYRWDKKRIEKLKKDKNPAIPPDSKDVAYVLLRHGADPKAAFLSQSVLSYAAEYNDLEMVRRLVELGADMDSPKNSLFTPLMIAARKGHVDIAKYLLERGANINAPYEKGEEPSPLDFVGNAIQSGELEMALLPLEYGVAPNIYLRLYSANTNNHPKNYRHKLIRALLEKGMSVKNHQLFSMIWDKDLITIKMLVEAGAPVCLRLDGETVYEEAKKKGYQEIADYLARKGGADCP